MTRVVFLAVWLGIAAAAFIAMTAALTAGQHHLLLTFGNTGSIACLGWWAVRETARRERWETFLGTWQVATPRGDHHG